MATSTPTRKTSRGGRMQGKRAPGLRQRAPWAPRCPPRTGSGINMEWNKGNGQGMEWKSGGVSPGPSRTGGSNGQIPNEGMVINGSTRVRGPAAAGLPFERLVQRAWSRAALCPSIHAEILMALRRCRSYSPAPFAGCLYLDRSHHRCQRCRRFLATPETNRNRATAGARARNHADLQRTGKQMTAPEECR